MRTLFRATRPLGALLLAKTFFNKNIFEKKAQKPDRITDYSTHPLQPVNIQTNFKGLATVFPHIPEDHKLLCVFDTQGAGDGAERIYTCDTIEDINDLLERYNQGLARKISFATVSKASFSNEKIMSREELLTLMRGSKSIEEWNRNCKIVKARFNGDYPPFWFETIIQSGVATEKQRTWYEQSCTALDRLSFHAKSPQESTNSVSNENFDKENRCKNK